ncbi:unnamed protein product [Cuscuta europaea]|uniref:Ubiquitin-like protease family profile domain-containing protein n=1 Tax=Cuscuta europaea TaxID=41803 RepID=A0A9P0ZC74_CUSEU|nr:unnamed protein product [Cuscuta europaea]
MAVAYNTPVGSLIHNVPMCENTIKVNICMAYREFEDCPLLYPNEAADMNVVADAVGSYVQWPSHLVFFEGEEPPSKSKKKDGAKKKVPFIVRDSPKVTVEPSSHSLVSETVLHSLTDDLLRLHENLEWYEPDLCKFSIPLHAELFCYIDDNQFGTVVDREDLSQFLESDFVDLSIIQTFMLCVNAKLIEFGRDDVGLLCPWICSFKYYQLDKKGTLTYMKHALTEMFEKNIILLAYNEGYHWVLFVICPKVDKGYIFNSLPSYSNIAIQKDLMMMYRVASTQKGRGKPIKWHNMKCARQTGNTECGYYVMKFIWEIITSVGSSDIAQVWNSRTEPYTTEEFDDIRKVWARFFVNEVL